MDLSPSLQPTKTAAAEETGVVAIIVSYNPDEAVFGRLLHALIDQVAQILVVDNGSRHVDVNAICDTVDENRQRIRFLPLDGNLGIAAAQNVGIEAAKAANADYVLLMDHDSIPMPGMVQELVRREHELRQGDIAVGAVGALTFDRRTGTPSKIARVSGLRVRRLVPAPTDTHVEADFLIASGTLIHAQVLERIGLMNESYFIDQVDTEWCFRARAQGWRLFVVPGARLEHAIGDKIIRVWFGHWRDIPMHSPARDYYTFRNITRMLREVPMSRGWRIMYLYRLAQYVVFFGLGVAPRLQRMRLMAKGLIDGLCRRGGPLA